jgi:uncharacterized surface protein with fasciclin (FAS1) repeats
MTMMQRRGLIACAPLAAAALWLRPGFAVAQNRTLADTLAADDRFKLFLDLVTRGSLVEEFRQAAPATVFAPVDQAFLNAPAGVLQDLTGRNTGGQNINERERDRLAELVRNHIVRGTIAPGSAGMPAAQRVRSVAGRDIEIDSSGQAMMVRAVAQPDRPRTWGVPGLETVPAASLAGAPIPASNGVIYPITQIIWP